MIYHVLFHIRADDAATSDLDLDGLCQDPTSQRLHGSGEGGRKHDCLTVGPHVVHNTHHLVEEPQHFTVHSVRKRRSPKGQFNNNKLNYNVSFPWRLRKQNWQANEWLVPPTCGSKPMSNILSASSNTTYVTLRRLVTRPKHTKAGEHEDNS